MCVLCDSLFFKCHILCMTRLFPFKKIYVNNTQHSKYKKGITDDNNVKEKTMH